MRKYNNESNEQLTQVVCNQCGKELKSENGYLKEGCFAVDYCFGYFSHKDGMRHKFDLCEECYDKMIARFQVPVDQTPENELL